MTGTGRRRGHQPQFTPTVQAIFLAAVRDGMHLQDAATAVGVHRNVPTRLARTNDDFKAALDDAKVEGRKVRIEAVPHREARNRNYGCGCLTCTTASRKNRATRRTRPSPPEHDETGGESGVLLTIQPSLESVSSFLLPRAS